MESPIWFSLRFPDDVPGTLTGFVPNTPRSPEGQARTRTALRQMLAYFAPGRTQFLESPKGPIIPTAEGHELISVSISYAHNTSWIALSRGWSIGIDAVSLHESEFCESLASLYLGTQARQGILEAQNRSEAFAIQWTIMEASLKAFGLSLVEHPKLPAAKVHSMVLDEVAISIAIAPPRTSQL